MMSASLAPPAAAAPAPGRTSSPLASESLSTLCCPKKSIELFDAADVSPARSTAKSPCSPPSTHTSLPSARRTLSTALRSRAERYRKVSPPSELANTWLRCARRAQYSARAALGSRACASHAGRQRHVHVTLFVARSISCTVVTSSPPP